MRRLLPPLLLLPGLAFAQLSAIALDLNGEDSVTVGSASCEEVLTVRWTINPFGACSDLNIWLAESNCGNEPAAGEHVVRSLSTSQLATNTEGSATFTVSNLPAFKTTACPRPDLQVTNKVCGAFKVTNTLGQCDTVHKDSTVSVVYDSKPPPTPVLTSVDPLDGALNANFEVPEDAFAFRVEVTETGTDAWRSTGLLTAGAAARFEGLVNGTVYDVRVIVEDEATNASPPSNVLQGTPLDSVGFWEKYKGGGGAGNGDCSSAGGFALWPALISMWAMGRRRR